MYHNVRTVGDKQLEREIRRVKSVGEANQSYLDRLIAEKKRRFREDKDIDRQIAEALGER